jgi:hypothetical protein
MFGSFRCESTADLGDVTQRLPHARVLRGMDERLQRAAGFRPQSCQASARLIC